jgi:hypothetical protein
MQVYNYDPTRANYDQSPKWRDLFDRRRAAFLSEVGRIGIAHMAVRLRWLNNIAEEAMTREDYKLVAAILEQAAKETGGMYTNRREVNAKVAHNYDDMTTEELWTNITEHLRKLGLEIHEAKTEGNPLQLTNGGGNRRH